MSMSMSERKRAYLEAAAVSVTAPFGVLLLYVYDGSFSDIERYSALFVIAAAYVFFVCRRRKTDLRDTPLFRAFISTVIQVAVMFAAVKLYLYLHPIESEGGHPDGGAVGLFLLVLAEPIVINIPPVMIWVIGKTVGALTKE